MAAISVGTSLTPVTSTLIGSGFFGTIEALLDAQATRRNGAEIIALNRLRLLKLKFSFILFSLKSYKHFWRLLKQLKHTYLVLFLY